jgi:hypothetical protein
MIISYSITTSYIEPKFAEEPILGVNGAFKYERDVYMLPHLAFPAQEQQLTSIATTIACKAVLDVGSIALHVSEATRSWRKRRDEYDVDEENGDEDSSGMRTPAARTIARKTRRVCWRVRHGQYISEGVSAVLRVTETLGSCTIRRDEYDVDEEDGGEDDSDKYAGE